MTDCPYTRNQGVVAGVYIDVYQQFSVSGQIDVVWLIVPAQGCPSACTCLKSGVDTSCDYMLFFKNSGHNSRALSEHLLQFSVLGHTYGAPFAKILYLTDLAQKLLSLAEIAISACRDVICGWDSISACRDNISGRDVISARDTYLCLQRCYLCQR